MGLAAVQTSAQFMLHIRCENCMRDSEKYVVMPVGEGVPRDADELIESVYLESIPFRCQPCGSVIGRLVGISGGIANGY